MHLSNAKNLSNQPKIENLLKESTAGKEKDKFCRDLCRAFVESGIPLFKLRHPSIRLFIEKYTPFKAPSETLIRTSYLEKEVLNDIEEMKNCLKDENIWIGIDETTDSNGRYIVIVLAGALNPDRYTKPFFIYLCRQNNTTCRKCLVLEK